MIFFRSIRQWYSNNDIGKELFTYEDPDLNSVKCHPSDTVSAPNSVRHY
jgi:hypothetical protein